MSEVKLTAKGKAFSIGFKGANGKSATKPLGERSDADLKEFLILAHRSGRQDYLEHFDNPPSLDALLKEKTDAALKAGPQIGVYESNPASLPPGVAHEPAMPVEDLPPAQEEAPAPAAKTSDAAAPKK